jgi:hypothetical protein
MGGCTTALLITDEAAAEVRPTFDVDVIAEITTYATLLFLSGCERWDSEKIAAKALPCVVGSSMPSNWT